MCLSDEPFAVWSWDLQGVPGAAPLIISASQRCGQLPDAFSEFAVVLPETFFSRMAAWRP